MIYVGDGVTHYFPYPKNFKGKSRDSSNTELMSLRLCVNCQFIIRLLKGKLTGSTGLSWVFYQNFYKFDINFHWTPFRDRMFVSFGPSKINSSTDVSVELSMVTLLVQFGSGSKLSLRWGMMDMPNPVRRIDVIQSYRNQHFTLVNMDPTNYLSFLKGTSQTVFTIHEWLCIEFSQVFLLPELPTYVFFFYSVRLISPIFV